MQLETEHLIMRDFREDDWPMLAAYWTDPRYQRFYPVNERQEETVRTLVASFVAAQAEQPRRKWQLALVMRDDGRLIGNCGIRVNDPELREANIGYELSPDYWGQGYASEAAQALVAWGFAQRDVRRIVANCRADNVASIRVLEKAGLRQTGRDRDDLTWEIRAEA